MAVPASSSTLTGLRVLVVDDDEGARAVLLSVLESEGAVVFAAPSAAAAVEAIDVHRPDVLLVDLSMPIVNGFTLVEQLRQRPRAAGGLLPVAALTGYLSGEDRARAMQAGFQAYLVKPVDLGVLLVTVQCLANSWGTWALNTRPMTPRY